jgi:hypothetical protein
VAVEKNKISKDGTNFAHWVKVNKHWAHLGNREVENIEMYKKRGDRQLVDYKRLAHSAAHILGRKHILKKDAAFVDKAIVWNNQLARHLKEAKHRAKVISQRLAKS